MQIKIEGNVGCQTFFVGTYQHQTSPEQTLRPDTDATRRPCLKLDLTLSNINFVDLTTTV